MFVHSRESGQQATGSVRRALTAQLSPGPTQGSLHLLTASKAPGAEPRPLADWPAPSGSSQTPPLPTECVMNRPPGPPSVIF